MSAIAGPGSAGDRGSDGPADGCGQAPHIRNLVEGDGNTVYQVGALTMIQPASSSELGRRHEVPPPVGEFFDRVEPLECLDAAATAPGVSVRIVVLAGPPGVGRRTVSRYWVHSRRLGPPLAPGRAFTSMFSGGEFHVDLSGGRHVTTEEVLRQLLVATGVRPDFIPVTLEERGRLFRSRTAGEPVIMVIEGAREHGQVTGLLPGCPGSVVLVVPHDEDRFRDLANAKFLPLEPFDDKVGEQMLAATCGARRVAAEPDAVRTLVSLCAGLPLGVSLAARHLAAHPGLSVGALVRQWSLAPTARTGRLAERERPMTGLDAVYVSLPADIARAYRRIGQIPGAVFDTELAAVAVGQPTEQTSLLLRGLVERGLLQDSDGPWWRSHELIVAHARERAAVDDTVEDRQAVLGRLLRHLRDGAVVADRLLFPVAYRPHDRAPLAPDADLPASLSGPVDAETPAERTQRAVNWLDERRDVALACLRENARSCAWDSEVWQLASAYTSLFLHRRHVSTWARTHEYGADAARRMGANDAEAWLRCMRSRPLTDQGMLAAAGAELERAQALAGRSANLVLRASVQEFTARHLDQIGDRPGAWRAFETCRRLNTQVGEVRGVALADLFEGSSRDAAGEHTRAIELFDRAQAAFTSFDDTRMAARTALALGIATARLGRVDEAVPLLEDAARALAETDALHYAADAHELLATLAERAGDLDAARARLRTLLDIHLKAGNDLKVDELRVRIDALPSAEPSDG